ncbi:hypothetical protein FXV83_16385 [Bradyrhizobium hipponense]|uniref:Uncharacterized protein n=1 Tax=Bradyrhizobium hipponense TaxID=2605638 RepID=A0A5S4YMC3_9BRAD|nr:hypothetical protein [Bradyrhizobium hipponense]TYO65510.1 hypothetical protein FXV83_16385 [Bradyrhizobium hipponense]
MSDLPPRRRGRPTKEEAAAYAAAAQDKQKKDNKETEYLDEVLAQPIKRRAAQAKLQPDEATLRTIGELGKLFCTQEEVAAVLGVSRRTFQTFISECQEARDVWDDGLMHAKVSLRRKQLSLADKNAPAAIFLGKNYLGQKDESTTNMNISKPVAEMSEAELMEIAQRKSAEPKPEAKKESVH